MREIFINPSGQQDNIGDSILRRYYLSHLRQSGQLVILVRGSADYRSGLGIEPADVVYESAAKWLWAAFVSATKRRASFAINAGEIVVDRKYWVIVAWNILVAAMVRATGGRVVAIGISLRDGPGRAIYGVKFLLRLAGMVSWRDPMGLSVVKRGELAPDWAFSEVRTEHRTTPRSLLAVVMRGDRPAPPASWMDWLQKEAAQRGLTIVVVVQVIRDRDRAAELASALNAELFDWSGGHHNEHERAVRSVYARSVCVVSDRMHALVLGVCEGAVPMGVGSTGTGKVSRSFAVIGDNAVSRTFDEMTEDPSWFSSRLDAAEKLTENAMGAKASVDLVAQQMEAYLAS